MTLETIRNRIDIYKKMTYKAIDTRDSKMAIIGIRHLKQLDRALYKITHEL